MLSTEQRGGERGKEKCQEKDLCASMETQDEIRGTSSGCWH